MAKVPSHPEERKWPGTRREIMVNPRQRLNHELPIVTGVGPSRALEPHTKPSLVHGAILSLTHWRASVKLSAREA